VSSVSGSGGTGRSRGLASGVVVGLVKAPGRRDLQKGLRRNREPPQHVVRAGQGGFGVRTVGGLLSGSQRFGEVAAAQGAATSGSAPVER